MHSTVDAFIEAVEAARRQLIRKEGANVSVRELLRRAGYTDSQRASVSYHLNRHRHTGEKPHHVDPEVVHRLAKALEIPEQQLTRAAAVAAGFDVVDTSSPDVAVVVQRFYGDENVSDETKQAVTAQLMGIIAEEMSRRFTSAQHAPDATGQ